MPNYDFHNCLSPREFEELVQDILEIKENVNFEISGRGRDGGVDLRHWHENTKIIVQVKCFQNSFNQLRYVLKNQELPKARALHPTRYILVTSLKIELEQRNEIYNLFDGIIKSRDDIIDRDDLNKLLRNNKYSNVERAHYKLWMSSTEVLSTILDDVVHRGILTESKFELMEIKEAIKTYVQNPSFGRALDIIDRNKYVLISGEPGVGKTTLARCLAAYYLERMDYKEFIYVDSVGSAFSMYKESEKQIFFFDDFWGDVFKETKHTNNEEKHLLKLIQHISKSKNKILILSTREYVLQQGLGQYYNEQLTNTLNDGKCFLELKDYSDLIKAKILFNHLYFSDLEWDYVKIIAERYELLTHHHNYNPRIIDTFLKLKSIFNENDPEKYYQGFIDYLNDPIQFWKEIFMKQTFEAKLICLILLVSSQPLRLNELKDSYHSCLEIARLNNISLQECEFADIIPQLEKTIILTYKAERIPSIIVKFQNSSIKEYLYQFLTDNLHFYGNILIRGCNYINQLLSMFRTSNKNFYIYEGGIEDALEREKILLPGNLKKQLICRIVNDFDILKYSYPEGDVYEHTPSIYTAKEDCVVRKLQDVFNSFGVNDDSEADGFLIGKMRDLCAKLHNEDYSFSYDDMVMFPYLVKDLIPLIDFDGAKLIQDYYEHSRFSEHLLVLNEFQNNFPGEFAHFKKMNHKMDVRTFFWTNTARRPRHAGTLEGSFLLKNFFFAWCYTTRYRCLIDS